MNASIELFSMPDSAVCRGCGGLLVIAPADRLCDDCRAAQRDRRRRWQNELGLPADAQPTFFTYDAGQLVEKSWDGWGVELLGISASCPAWPPPWPFWRIGPLLYQIWSRRLYPPDSTALLEARWHPEWGEAVLVRGPERLSRADANRALDGLRLLPYTDGRGRPVGTGTFASREEFVTVVTEAIRAARLQHQPVTQERVAALLPRRQASPHQGKNFVTARQLRSWCARFGIAWDELKRLA